MRNLLDPFGIASACWKVQKAWLAHPRELEEQLAHLTSELWALADWQRHAPGRNHQDLIPPSTFDERFSHPLWTENPYLDTFKECYLLYSRWLTHTIQNTPGVDEATRRKAAFWTSETLNALAPTNYFWTNPQALMRALETGGQSLLEGGRRFMADADRGSVSMVEHDTYEAGRNLATTPGAVVFRNELVELIQYTPTTETVHAVPIVFIPPWINKYYVLDLNEKRSLVRFLVAQGFTVFIVSWKNPGRDMRDTTFEDYMLNGALAAVNAAREICGASQVHLAGYCIGGTLVSSLLAWLARRHAGESTPVAHTTLLTTLVDFEEPGEVEVFIDEESIEAIEAMMARRGYLDGRDMAGSFRSLRSNSLVWHYWVNNYLYGESPGSFDVLHWNMDTTRMPQAMHAFYLREFYLNNRLIEPGGIELGGEPIDLARIDQPMYVVGTEQDHIAPWQSTFRICALVGAPVRYVLASSGHILGVLSPPTNPPKRRYWAGEADGHTDAEAWRADIAPTPDSWWSDWIAWLRERCGESTSPPPLGTERYPRLADAPGTYVFEQ